MTDTGPLGAIESAVASAGATLKTDFSKLYTTAVDFVDENGAALEATVVADVKEAAANLGLKMAPVLKTFVDKGTAALAAELPFLSPTQTTALTTEEAAITSELVAQLQARLAV